MSTRKTSRATVAVATKPGSRYRVTETTTIRGGLNAIAQSVTHEQVIEVPDGAKPPKNAEKVGDDTPLTAPVARIQE